MCAQYACCHCHHYVPPAIAGALAERASFSKGAVHKPLWCGRARILLCDSVFLLGGGCTTELSLRLPSSACILQLCTQLCLPPPPPCTRGQMSMWHSLPHGLDQMQGHSACPFSRHQLGYFMVSAHLPDWYQALYKVLTSRTLGCVCSIAAEK